MNKTLAFLSYLISFLLSTVAASALAQEFSVTTLSTQSLLPSASIHCIFQDSEGFMWYGTEGGLCRDNGYQIDVFRPSALEAYAVSCIAEDGNGNILFGTSEALYRIDKSDYRWSRLELDSARHSIGAIFNDSGHHIWVGALGTIFECDDTGQLLGSYPCQLDGLPAHVVSFFEDRQGTLYAMQLNSGILRKRKGDNAFAPLQWPLEATPLLMIESPAPSTEKGVMPTYWVATNGAGIQLMTIDDSPSHVGDSIGRCLLTAQTATQGDIKRERALHMLCDARNGLFWTTTHDDLYAYQLDGDGNLQEFPLRGLLPPGRKILDQMCQDKEGNLYVSGFTPHTFVITSSHKDVRRIAADAIRHRTGYPLLADRSVCDGQDHIWIWQGRQGLVLYDKATDHVIDSPVRSERTIQACSLGGIWASNSSVVYRLWQERGMARHEVMVNTREGSRICCMFEKSDEALYVATESHLYRLTLKGRQFTTIADLPSAPREMTVTADGTAYLAMGNEGLLCISPKGEVQCIDDVSESILSVCSMSEGSVWASTNEGNVYRYNPSDMQLSKEPLLSSPNRAPIKCVRTDGLGHVWTLTDQQVCEYAPQSRAFRTFRSSDQSIDVSYFYALEVKDASHICIDGAGAIIEVESSSELSVQETAHVRPRVTAVEVGGVKRLIGHDAETLRLSADEEDFTLEFTTLEHLHASSIRFAYKMEDIQDRWVFLPQGTNSIVITNLPKGNHRLRLMSTDRHGLWSEPVDAITIHRAPHWWETWWAYIIYICIAAGVAYSIWRLERRIHLLHKLIKRRQEVRLDEIEMKRDDIAEQQRDDEFLRRAVTKTEEHLSDTDYNVEALASDMCMSRITLYRRIQEQTGQSPTEFIRDIRLKKAAQLLTQHPDATIADIARKVGFATPKYFSRCFKDKFGVLPKDYNAPS